MLSILSVIQVRKIGLMPQTYLEHLRNALPKIKGYRMNSYRIRNKIELWIEDRLVTKVVDILIFKGIIKGVLCWSCVSPTDGSLRKYKISIMILKKWKMNKHTRCFSYCWWEEALLPEKGWNSLMKLQHFPGRSICVDVVWHVLSESEIPEVWLPVRYKTCWP